MSWIDESGTRSRIAEADAEHALWRDRLVLRTCVLGLAVVVVSCLALDALPGTSAEGRGWARSMLSVIVGASIAVIGMARK